MKYLNSGFLHTLYLVLLVGLFMCFSSQYSDAQVYLFSPPVKLGENVNSPAEESMPLISPLGDKLYFVRTFYEFNIGGKLSGQDIWVSTRNELGQWEPATNQLININNQRNNAVIGFNTDGTALYLLNSYRPNTTKIHGIAKSIRVGNEWSKPYDIRITGLESENSFIGFYMNPTEDVLFISMNAPGSYGEEDLYVSIKGENGRWSKPENLGATINTKGFEISPYLAPDGETLFFSSDGHDGFGGADIYMAKRLYDSWIIWTKPINLGSDINSEGFEAYLSIYDNKEAYFVSNKGGEFADIYMSEIILKEDKIEVAEINKSKYKLTESEIQELLGFPLNRTIYFEFGSFNVAPSSRELIYFLANKLVENPDYNIELVGHTSEEGTEDFNKALSLNRAKEVAKYFEEFGISPDRISTKGMGETRPVVTEGTEDELAKNRRVEIYFTK